MGFVLQEHRKQCPDVLFHCLEISHCLESQNLVKVVPYPCLVIARAHRWPGRAKESRRILEPFERSYAVQSHSWDGFSKEVLSVIFGFHCHPFCSYLGMVKLLYKCCGFVATVW